MNKVSGRYFCISLYLSSIQKFIPCCSWCSRRTGNHNPTTTITTIQFKHLYKQLSWPLPLISSLHRRNLVSPLSSAPVPSKHYNKQHKNLCAVPQPSTSQPATTTASTPPPYPTPTPQPVPQHVIPRKPPRNPSHCPVPASHAATSTLHQTNKSSAGSNTVTCTKLVITKRITLRWKGWRDI